MMENQKKAKKIPNIVILILCIILIALIYRRIYQAQTKDGLNFTGDIRYQNNINKNNIKITIPSNFKDTGGKNNYLISRDGENPVFSANLCSIMIDNALNYKNAEHLAEGMSNFYKTNYEKRTIGGYSWYYLSTNKTFHTQYYLTDYKGKLIIMTAESLSNDCDQELEIIINSISLK